MIRNLVTESIENFKCFCDFHRGNYEDQIKEITEIRRKKEKTKIQFSEETELEKTFKHRAELDLKN